MSTVKNYLSLIKFSHTIFAMPFALIGFFLGVHYFFDLSLVFIDEAAWSIGSALEGAEINFHGMKFTTFVLFRFSLVILCMIFARSAAMAFNRYLDRKIDAENPRTAIREIPAGIISAKKALWFTIINAILFIVSCYFINPICFYLSPVALFIILFYSYTKRFTALCHLVLGLGLSLAPIGAYLAITGKFDWLPIFFSFTVLFWVSGFDIIYALQDEEFDKTQHLHSIPSVLGKKNALMVSRLLHICAGVSIIFAGYYAAFGFWYWTGVAGFVAMLIYQHSIVKPHDLKRVNLAFMTANGIASVVFAVFVVLDLFLS